MSKSLFEAFNKEVNVEELKKDVQATQDEQKEFEDVPHGTYNVTIEKMVQVMTKETNKPMLSVWFNIKDGKHKGQKLFMNQVIVSPYPIVIARKFLESLESGVDVKFEDYVQFYDTILDVFEAIEGKREYNIEFSENKGYDKFEIVGVFEAENVMLNERDIPESEDDEEDLPF